MPTVNGVGSTQAGAIFVPQNPTDPVSVASALATLRVKPNTTVVITDTVQNIQANLDALQKVAGKITSLATTDSSQKLSVTAAQYAKDTSLLAKWGATSGNTVEVTGVKAASAQSLVAAKAGYVTSITVADTSGNIQKKLDDLQSLVSSGDLRQIVQSGASAALKITAAQLASDSDALGAIKNGAYTLAITNASVSDTLGLGSSPALTANAKIKSIDVQDTTDAIDASLDTLQSAGLKIKSISQTDAGTALNITGAQYKQDAAALGKILTNYHLTVIRAAAAQTSALASNQRVLTVSVADNAANISKKWSLMQQLTDSLTAVEVTDSANAINITADQLALSETLLSKFTDDQTHTYKLAVSSVSAGTAAAVADVDHVDSIAVTDTAANVAANLDDLHAVNDLGLLSSVTLSGKVSTLSMDASRLQGSALTDTQSVLNKIAGGGYTLAVTGVALTNLNDIASNAHVIAMEVGGASNQIESNLDALYQLGKKVTAIQQSDSGTALDVTQSTLESRANVLAKIAGGYSVNVSDVSANKALADSLNNHVARIDVSDTGQNIVTNWDALRSIGAPLTSVAKTDGGSLSLSADQYQAGVNDQLVGKFDASLKFSVFGASVVQATQLGSDGTVDKIDVTDDGSAVTASLSDLDTLRTDGKLNSIALTTPAASLALHASQLDDAQGVLGLIAGGRYTLAVDQVDVADAQDLASGNSKITSMKVTGDASSIVDNLTDLAAVGRKLQAIQQTDAGSTALELTGTQFQQNQGTLGKITGGYLANLSNVGAAQAANFAASSHVQSLAVSDTGAQIAAAWSTLGTLGAKLGDVAQSDSSPLQLTINQWHSAPGLSDKFSTSLAVSVSGASVSDVAALDSDDAVTQIQVTDNAAAISSALDDLAAESKLTQLQVSDSSNALTMSADTYGSSSDLIGKISGQYHVALSDVAVTDAATLAADAHVSAMDVTGDSTAIASNFSTLSTVAHLHSLTLSDEGGTLSLGSGQILGGASTLAKISNAYQIAATGVAMSDLADIQAVDQVATIGLSDTAQNVSDNFDDVLSLSSSLSSIHLTDSTPVLALTEESWQSGASALGKIDGSYQVDLSEVVAGDASTIATDSTVHQLSVSDTSGDIADHWDTLVSLYNDGAGKLAGITLTDADPLTLTAQQQSDGANMIDALLPDATIVTA